MKLTVVFEHWHLGDGNYPPFSVGDTACLSFELDARTAAVVSSETPLGLEQIVDADYRVTASVVRIYPDEMGSQFAVFNGGGLRFYCPTEAAAKLRVGDVVLLEGPLLLDHYMWVEFLDRYPDPPDLFYSVQIDRIREVTIPERFIQRSERTVSSPTSVGPADYGGSARDVTRVGSDADTFAFSLLDLSVLPESSRAKKPTFLGA
jgi:hypothetical protein